MLGSSSDVARVDFGDEMLLLSRFGANFNRLQDVRYLIVPNPRGQPYVIARELSSNSCVSDEFWR